MKTIGKKRKFIPLEEIEDESKALKESISAIESKEKEEEEVPTSAIESKREEVLPVFRPNKKASKSGFNQNILYDYVRRPSSFPHAVVYNDENCVIIKDAYPKALVHLLLIPKETFLIKHSVREFVPSDLSKLQTLHKTAKEFAQLIKGYLQDDKGTINEKLNEEPSLRPFLEEVAESEKGQKIGKFLFGYHLIPSLHPIHLHIISYDFNSDHLKTKKHWNSFTTDFFLSSDRVEEILAGNMEIRSVYSEENAEELLKEKMRCHICYSPVTSIPGLKRHLWAHYLSCMTITPVTTD